MRSDFLKNMQPHQRVRTVGILQTTGTARHSGIQSMPRKLKWWERAVSVVAVGCMFFVLIYTVVMP